jgi:hypothetical protein
MMPISDINPSPNPRQNRPQGDEVSYPADDIAAKMDEHGTWRFTRKDGTPY